MSTIYGSALTCAGCKQPISDPTFTWTGTGMYHNYCAKGIAPAPALLPAHDLRGVLTVLERLLPQHKNDSMRGQIEAAIAQLRTSGVPVVDRLLTTGRQVESEAELRAAAGVKGKTK